MEPVEAESVLMALAHYLEWIFVACPGFDDTWLARLPDERCYETYRYPWKEIVECRCLYPDGDEADLPHKAPDVAAAKAACERHHVTGKWE